MSNNRLSCCLQCGPVLDGKWEDLDLSHLPAADIFRITNNNTLLRRIVPDESCGHSALAWSIYLIFQMVMAYIVLSIMIGACPKRADHPASTPQRRAHPRGVSLLPSLRSHSGEFLQRGLGEQEDLDGGHRGRRRQGADEGAEEEAEDGTHHVAVHGLHVAREAVLDATERRAIEPSRRRSDHARHHLGVDAL